MSANSTIHVRSSHNIASQGKLEFANQVLPCMIGRSGIRAQKCEGDGATPIGSFEILHGFYRPDRIMLAPTSINFVAIKNSSGWCDDPNSRAYNQFVTLPHNARHEKLWRDDSLYDIVLVLNHNTTPRIQNRGSAIFFHLTDSTMKPTEGCIAVSLENMQKLIRRIQMPCRFTISQ